MFSMFKSTKEKFSDNLYHNEITTLTETLSHIKQDIKSKEISPGQIYYLYQVGCIVYGASSLRSVNKAINRSIKNIEENIDSDENDLVDDEFLCHYARETIQELINRTEEQLNEMKIVSEKLKTLNFTRVKCMKKDSNG